MLALAVVMSFMVWFSSSFTKFLHYEDDGTYFQSQHSKYMASCRKLFLTMFPVDCVIDLFAGVCRVLGSSKPNLLHVPGKSTESNGIYGSNCYGISVGMDLLSFIGL